MAEALAEAKKFPVEYWEELSLEEFKKVEKEYFGEKGVFRRKFIEYM